MTAILAQWKAASRITRADIACWVAFGAWVMADGIARLF